MNIENRTGNKLEFICKLASYKKRKRDINYIKFVRNCSIKRK